MVIKINYTSSDIYVSTNVSPIYVVVNYSGTTGGGGGVWGAITGTLSDQTDLQAALDAKFDDPTGTTSQYLRGDGSLATFPTIPSGTVTSVGLTMPSAFSVANSPVTSAGTLAVTGAGTAAQYVRGDGALATFPTTASGGSSVNYYLNGSVASSVTGYKQMANTAVIGLGTDFNLVGNGLIAQFLTDAGNPNRIEIPGGAWNFEMYFSVSSSGGNQKFYVELLKYNGSTFTSIATGSTNPEEITGGTATDLYLTSLAVPTTSLLVTDRLAIRVYIVDNSIGRTITLHTEDNNLCEILTTFAGGIAALNGLTTNTQYLATGTSGTDFNISSVTDTHTFNLPTASATNRGALSSANWSTFNSKVGGNGVAGQIAYWDGTNSQTGSNNLFWDSVNNQLRIQNLIDISSINASTLDFLRVNARTTSNGIAVTYIPKGIPNSLAYAFECRKDDTTFASLIFAGGNTQGPAANKNIIATSNEGNRSDRLVFRCSPNNTNWSLAPDSLVVTPASNIIISNVQSPTDSGQRLQVYGDAFIKGSGNTSGTTALTVQNSDGVNVFRARNEGRIFLGSSSTSIFPMDKSTTSISLSGNGLSFFDTSATSGSTFYFTGSDYTHTSGIAILLNATRLFWPTSGTGTLIMSNISPNINQTGGANGITRGLYVNPTLTAAADWRSIEWSNNSGWGLYGAGTANNYLAGKLLIGTTTVGTFNLDVSGTARVSGNLTIGSAPATQNITLDTTSATQNLQFFKSGSYSSYLWVSGGLNHSSSPGGGTYLPFTGSAFNGNLCSLSEGMVNLISGSLPNIVRFFATGVIEQGVIGYAAGGNVMQFRTNKATSISNGSLAMAIFENTNVSINSATDVASAQLQVTSTTKGFLPPRMTTTEKNAISTPATGLQVYDTTLNASSFYDGATWRNDNATFSTNRQAASYTFALTDRGKLIEMNVATANNLTVPLNSVIAFPIGTKIDIAQYGAGQTTIVATSGVTIRSAGGALKLAAQYSGASLVKIATDEWYLFGDITV